MYRFTTFILALFTFGLGFFSSEYLHRRAGQLQPQPPLIELNRIEHPAGIAPTGIASATKLVDDNSPVREIMGVGPTVPFSWSNVKQLIVSARYDEAIRQLQSQLSNAKNSAQAWYLLAQVYQRQEQPIAALDAWFRYIKLEVDRQKIDRALGEIKRYLVQLKQTPISFNEDYSWLISQYDELLKYTASDGELHLHMASLYVKMSDNYQAQYHALMAANDPAVQQQAEAILATLSGKKLTQDITIPLLISGNQYIINATVEGYPVRLLLDTGASLSGLSSSYTAAHPSLVKDRKPIRLNTAGGIKDSFLFTVSNLNIGSLEFNQHILGQLPMDDSGGFDGLLGVDILGRFDVVIDQDAEVLRVRARKR